MYDTTAGAGHPTPGWPPAPAPWAPAPQRQPGTALAVVSLVASLLALLGVLLIAGFLFLNGSSGPSGTLTGQVTLSRTGGPLAGRDLSSTVGTVVAHDGGDVTGMRCPATPRVDQGVVTVCHGTISGETWAVVVFFEDPTGRFTLSPL
ncbi:DUF4333 domain-containing protein [Oryzihumus sp.]|jgi:hypothetical protein|uniref:DUF4333 domain-containing protein n=1 Tax=Oryzihumus sp. TaxID=1968903 RepID=UPI002ED82EF0